MVPRFRVLLCSIGLIWLLVVRLARQVGHFDLREMAPISSAAPKRTPALLRMRQRHAQNFQFLYRPVSLL